jgi:hypothetical protein
MNQAACASGNTWHGLEKRPMHVVRGLMEIDYVSDAWRDGSHVALSRPAHELSWDQSLEVIADRLSPAAARRSSRNCG